jgi:hypothetical protein
MALYYFHARYRGTMVSDDVPEEFSTVAEAENHAAIVASEFGRNGGGPVTVFVYGEDGMLIATKGIRTKSYS